MIDDHRLGAALGLRALTRIVDDKRIKMGQWREDRLRKALRRQSQRFAGKPFERTVLAEMDDRVGAKILAQPRISREIAVRRHQGGVVVGRFRVDVVAACRLDQHRYIPGTKSGDRKPPAIEPARAEERVAFGQPPALADGPLHGG